MNAINDGNSQQPIEMTLRQLLDRVRQQGGEIRAMANGLAHNVHGGARASLSAPQEKQPQVQAYPTTLRELAGLLEHETLEMMCDIQESVAGAHKHLGSFELPDSRDQGQSKSSAAQLDAADHRLERRHR